MNSLNNLFHRKNELAICLLLLVLTSAIPGTSSAQTSLVVVNNLDSGPGSLRDAITTANTVGGSTVTFSNVTGIIQLTNGGLSIQSNMNIVGPGPSSLRIIGPPGASDTSTFTVTSSNLVTIAGLAIRGQPAVAPGGGIFNSGNLMMTNCVVTNSGNGGSPGGGGIYNSGTLVLNSCTLAGNSVSESGGGLYNAGVATLNNSIITNNSGRSGGGGGIYNVSNLVLNGCSVCGNSSEAWNGGGISSSGTLIMNGCNITRNGVGDTGGSGGGMSVAGTTVMVNSTVSSNFSGFGSAGGIYVIGGTLCVTNCTISFNGANAGGLTVAGGGILNQGTVVLVNSTVSGNHADFSSSGGGIANQATLTLINCTVCSNRAGYGPGMGNVGNGGGVSGNFNSLNSIFSGNTALGGSGPDCYGTMTSQGNNLILNTNGCAITGTLAGNLIGVDPKLGPLQNNGGPTLTHALLAGSPAIDAGNAVGAPATDQRGVSRPQGVAVDIGAYEYQFTVAVPVFQNPQPSGGSLKLQGSGSANTRYTLQESTNLTSWSDLAPLVTDQSGNFQFTDGSFGSKTNCFYRIKFPAD